MTGSTLNKQMAGTPLFTRASEGALRRNKSAWLHGLTSLSLVAGCALAGACEESDDAPTEEASPDAALSADGGRDTSVADARVSDAASGSNADAASTGNGDAGTASTSKIGEFSLQLVAPVPASGTTSATAGFTALLGKVFDGPPTDTTSWAKKDEAEGCTLLTPKVPFCEKACGSGSVCVADDTCLKSPTAIGLGTLTVKGVKTQTGETEFTTTTTKETKYTYQTPVGASLPFPAFAEGDPVELSLSGDSGIAAFTLMGVGIAPLTLVNGESYPLTKGKPLELTWTAPSKATSSRIQVKLDISHHGGSKGKIECDVADDGTLTIPATLVDALTALGVAGFPTIVLTRSAISSSSTARGRVDLRLYSYVERAIEVPGLVSCSGADDCPAGKSCREDLTCG